MIERYNARKRPACHPGGRPANEAGVCVCVWPPRTAAPHAARLHSATAGRMHDARATRRTHVYAFSTRSSTSIGSAAEALSLAAVTCATPAAAASAS